MGGNARSVNDFGLANFGPDHPLAKTAFDMSDINLSLIRTVGGRTVYLFSDTLFPRPEPRNCYRLLGSKGIYDQSIDKLYFEGKSPQRSFPRGMGPVAKYRRRVRPSPLESTAEQGVGQRPGGGRFPLPLSPDPSPFGPRLGPTSSVCDAAAWSSIVELTERSARNRSAAVEVPDFTRGRWKTTPPAPIRAG